MFITYATLEQAVKDQLQLSSTETLEPYWTTIINRSLTFGYWEIVQAFIQRGYSKAVIDQWDRGAEFQTDLGVWNALQMIATQTTVKVEQHSLELTDRREELGIDIKYVGRELARYRGKFIHREAVMITIDGVLIQPDTNIGQPSTGPIEGGGSLGYPWEQPAANGPPWDDRPLDPNFEVVP